MEQASLYLPDFIGRRILWQKIMVHQKVACPILDVEQDRSII
jgi:hypothetical protein